MEIQDLIGDNLPIITDGLIESVKKAFIFPNSTFYHLANGDEVCSFLEEHKGKKCFTISW